MKKRVRKKEKGVIFLISFPPRSSAFSFRVAPCTSGLSPFSLSPSNFYSPPTGRSHRIPVFSLVHPCFAWRNASTFFPLGVSRRAWKLKPTWRTTQHPGNSAERRNVRPPDRREASTKKDNEEKRVNAQRRKKAKAKILHSRKREERRRHEGRKKGERLRSRRTSEQKRQNKLWGRVRRGEHKGGRKERERRRGLDQWERGDGQAGGGVLIQY